MNNAIFHVLFCEVQQYREYFSKYYHIKVVNGRVLYALWPARVHRIFLAGGGVLTTERLGDRTEPRWNRFEQAALHGLLAEQE